MAEAALPIAGRALGTVGGEPVGGMIGGKLASAAGWVFGLELEGLSAEDREFEVARRFARFASATTKNALSAPPTANPQTVAKRAAAVAGRRLAPGLIRQGGAALSNTANGKGGAAIGGETEKKEGEMRVRLRFFVDGYSQNSRLLRIFKPSGVKDLARVVIHRTDSAGLQPSPPLFFGLVCHP